MLVVCIADILGCVSEHDLRGVLNPRSEIDLRCVAFRGVVLWSVCSFVVNFRSDPFGIVGMINGAIVERDIET